MLTAIIIRDLVITNIMLSANPRSFLGHILVSSAVDWKLSCILFPKKIALGSLSLGRGTEVQFLAQKTVTKVAKYIFVFIMQTGLYA